MQKKAGNGEKTWKRREDGSINKGKCGGKKQRKGTGSESYHGERGKAKVV